MHNTVTIAPELAAKADAAIAAARAAAPVARAAQLLDADAREAAEDARLAVMDGDADATPAALAEAQANVEHAALVAEVQTARAARTRQRAGSLDARLQLGTSAAHVLADVLGVPVTVTDTAPTAAPKKADLPHLFIVVKTAQHRAAGIASGALDLILYGRSVLERLPDAAVIDDAFTTRGWDLSRRSDDGVRVAEDGSSVLSLRASSAPEWLPLLDGVEPRAHSFSWDRGLNLARRIMAAENMRREVATATTEPVVLLDKPAGDDGVMLRKIGVRLSVVEIVKTAAQEDGYVSERQLPWDDAERAAYAGPTPTNAQALALVADALSGTVDNLDPQHGRVDRVEILQSVPSWGAAFKPASKRHRAVGDVFANVWTTYRAALVEDAEGVSTDEGDGE